MVVVADDGYNYPDWLQNSDFKDQNAAVIQAGLTAYLSKEQALISELRRENQDLKARLKLTVTQVKKAFDDGFTKGQSAKETADTGRIGERMITDLVKEYFPAAVVEELGKAHKPHCTDVRVMFPDGVSLLIEVKNRKDYNAWRKDDLSKFNRDIGEVDAVSGALYVSVKDTKRKNPVNFGVVGNIPVAYVDAVENNPIYIKIAVQALHDMASRGAEPDITKMKNLVGKVKLLVQGKLVQKISEIRKHAVATLNHVKNLEESIYPELDQLLMSSTKLATPEKQTPNKRKRDAAKLARDMLSTAGA